MILDFSAMEETAKKNFYGGEKELLARMHQDDLNRIMYSTLKPGASIGLHTHETSSEIIYVLQGTASVLYDGQPERLRPGVCHYCPKGHSHTILNDGDEDLIIFAAVPQQ